MGSYYTTTHNTDEIEQKPSIDQSHERKIYKTRFDEIETSSTTNDQSVKTEHKKSDLNDSYPKVKIVSPKNDKFIVIVIGGDKFASQSIEMWDISDWISKDNVDDLNEKTFLQFKDLCSFFPVRRKGSYYQQIMSDLYQKPRIMGQSSDIMSNFTRSKNFNERLNIDLAIDHPRLMKCSNEIKQLKCCIDQLFPKHKGLCYFKTRMSVDQIWSFELKNTFYIPNFLFTKVNKDDVSEGNVLFIIDTTEFNKFTTLIEHTNECLIACYNVFQWVDYKFNTEENFVTVTLKIINDDLLTQPSKGKDNGDIAEKYLRNIYCTNYDIKAKDLDKALLDLFQIQ